MNNKKEKGITLIALVVTIVTVTPWELGMPEASDLTERKELSKAGSITGVKS